METTVVEKFDSGLHPRFSRLAARGLIRHSRLRFRVQ